MKKFKLFALTALLAMGTNAFAGWTTVVDKHAVGSIVYKLEQDGTKKQATVLGVATGTTATTLTIPATITVVDTYAGEYPVVAIDGGWEALTGAKDMTGVATSLSIDVTNFTAALAATAIDGFTKLETLTIKDDGAADKTKTTEFPASAINAGAKSTLKTVTLSNNITKIAANAFQDCTKLETINLDNIKEYGDYALTATALKTINIAKAEKIGKGVFGHVKTITELVIPATVKAIDADAFKGMLKLAKVTINIDNADLTTIGTWFDSDAAIDSIAVNSTKITTIADDAFKAATNLRILDLSGATKLATIKTTNSAFGTSAKLETVKLYGTALTSIDAISFSSSASTLKEVTLPAKLTTIADNAFKNCVKLTSITLPDELTSIGSSAFNGCKLLEAIVIPAKCTEIKGGAFMGCEALASVKINGKVANEAGYIFDGCKALESIDLSKTALTKLADNFFNGCVKLATITLPETVTTIAGNSLAGTIIKELNAPNVTLIANNALGANDGTRAENKTLQKVVLGAAIIWSYTFDNCTALTDVTIPFQDATDAIGANAFNRCTALKSFKWDATTATYQSINDNAFSNCTPYVKIITTSAYIGAYPTAPKFCVYDGGASKTFRTVADASGAAAAYGLLYDASNNIVVNSADAKVYTVYVDVDDEVAYFTAMMPTSGKYNIPAGTHAILKTATAQENIPVEYNPMAFTPSPLLQDNAFTVTAETKYSDFLSSATSGKNADVPANATFGYYGNYLYRLTNNAKSGGFGFTSFTGTLKPGSFFILLKTQPASGRLNIVWLDENGNVEGDATAISTIEKAVSEGVIYNMAGQQVDANYKGVVIKNGKKMIQK